MPLRADRRTNNPLATMETDTQERLSARITGRVQGVGFRNFTQMRARQLGVSGWVRNEQDGSVRLEAEGPRGALVGRRRRRVRHLSRAPVGPAPFLCAHGGCCR